MFQWVAQMKASLERVEDRTVREMFKAGNFMRFCCKGKCGAVAGGGVESREGF